MPQKNQVIQGRASRQCLTPLRLYAALWGMPSGLGLPRNFQQALSQPQVFCSLTWSVCPCRTGLSVFQDGRCEAAHLLHLGTPADRNTSASYSEAPREATMLGVVAKSNDCPCTSGDMKHRLC